MHASSNNTEISYKIASRAAWLLGVDGPDRVAIFKRARDLYNARSMAVHSGMAPKEGKNYPGGVEAALNSYDKLCAAIIIKIALQGKWPDWLKLVLNAEEPFGPATVDIS